ncbi:hypothetical protein pb186bvf_017317 [Paramecium bursaria]
MNLYNKIKISCCLKHLYSRKSSKEFVFNNPNFQTDKLTSLI